MLESHLRRWLSDFWALPFPVAAQQLTRRVLANLRPDGEEGWRAKLDRAVLAARHASHPRSDDEVSLRGRVESEQAD